MSYSPAWQAARTRRALRRAVDPQVQARALEHAKEAARGKAKRQLGIDQDPAA